MDGTRAAKLEIRRGGVLDGAEEYRRAVTQSDFLAARALMETRLREFEKAVRANTLIDCIESIEQVRNEE